MKRWQLSAAILCAAWAPLAGAAPKPEHPEEEGAAIRGPLALTDAVRLATARHPSIEAHRAAARAADAQVRAVRSSQRLGITAANYFTDGNAPLGFTAPSPALPVGTTAEAPFNYGYTMPSVPHYGQNVMFMLPLYNGGRGKAQLRSVAAGRQAAEARAVGAEQDVALQTKTAYWGVQWAREVAAARQGEREAIESRLRYLEERYEKDGIALYEVLRHRAELARARLQARAADRDMAIAWLDLKMVLGVPAETTIELSDPLALTPVEGTLAMALATAERQSPEWQSAEAECAAAEEGLRAARRASRPSVYACLVQANAANIGARGLNGRVGGIMTYFPLFDSGLRRANRESAEARVREEKADCDAVRRRVKRDVAAAWTTLEAARDNVSVSEAAVAQAEESFAALQLRFEARRATQAELLDALAAVTGARLDRARALYEYNLARAQLDRAVGRI